MSDFIKLNSTSKTSEPYETPHEFLDNTVDALYKTEGLDAELMDILAKHILCIQPDKDAVSHTLESIVALATARATDKS